MSNPKGEVPPALAAYMAAKRAEKAAPIAEPTVLAPQDSARRERERTAARRRSLLLTGSVPDDAA